MTSLCLPLLSRSGGAADPPPRAKPSAALAELLGSSEVLGSGKEEKYDVIQEMKAWDEEVLAVTFSNTRTDLGFDPISFWSDAERVMTYPILSALATRYLSIQATSVACEGLFSKAGLWLSLELRIALGLLDRDSSDGTICSPACRAPTRQVL